MVILLQQELLKASLNLGLYRHMALKFLRIPALQQDSVLAVILVHQCRDVSLWHSLHIFGQLIDRIGVHFPAELHLGLHLVAFGDSHIPHVVRKSRHPYMAALHDAYRGAHPGCYAAHHLFISPVAHNNLSLNTHAGYHMAVFPVSMGGLVLIHEIHVNGIVGNLLVELCMEMHQGLSVFLQSQNPGLGR